MTARRLASLVLCVPIVVAALWFAIRPLTTGVDAAVLVIVDTTADTEAADGFCSLREAIVAVNGNINYFECFAQGTPLHSIRFGLGAGTPLIQIGATPLPAITRAVSINGSTGGSTRVEIRGPGGPLVGGAHGLTVNASGVTIRAMAITNSADDGIFVSNASANFTLVGSYVGMGADGMTAMPNQGFGVQIQGDGAVIGGATSGGPCTGDCNVISGNVKDNVLVDDEASGTTIKGNFIGPDVTGNGPNSLSFWHGVSVRGTSVSIGGGNGTSPGGSCTGDCNLISRNNNGIFLHANSRAVDIQGNFIGTNVTGTESLGNFNGVFEEAPNPMGSPFGVGATIGDFNASGRNVISGNEQYGVRGAYGVVIGNFIGTNAAGTAPVGNGSGVQVLSPGLRLGGALFTSTTSCTGTCNLISGNSSAGVRIPVEASGAVIEGNFIGTDVTGTFAVGNDYGVFIAVADAVVGGTMPGAGNLISGNEKDGILATAAGSVTIIGNRIGTDASGEAALPNDGSGVYVVGTSGMIGGTDAGTRNIISGNSGPGIWIDGSTNMRVHGNYIGASGDGTGALGNGSHGVVVTGNSDNIDIGVNPPGTVNRIAHNGEDGVSIQDGVGTALIENEIFDNGDLGIDLNDDGVTPNDPDDSDTGPNDFQNFPIINAVTSDGGNTKVQGELNSLPNTEYIVLYFDSADCDPSGYGEGEIRIGYGGGITDASGHLSIDDTLAVAFSTVRNVTAIAVKDAGGNTSEFSECFEVGQPGTPTASPTPPATATPTPTPPGQTPTTTPTPTATPTPAPDGFTQGDNDCDGDSDAVDALVSLQSSAALPYNQQPDCIDIGAAVPAGVEAQLFGDIDCDGDVDAVDALQILRFVAGLPVNQEDGCPEIGEVL